MINFADILALIIVVFCIVQGYRRGLSGELARAVSIVVVLFLGIMFHASLGSWIADHTRLEGRAAVTVAYLLILLLAVLLAIVINMLVKGIIKFVLAEGADKLLGLIIGFLRGLAVVLIIFILFNLWPHEYLNRIFGEQSMIGSVVVRYLPEIEETVPLTGDI